VTDNKAGAWRRLFQHQKRQSPGKPRLLRFGTGSAADAPRRGGSGTKRGVAAIRPVQAAARGLILHNHMLH
jgi:hypothetical protein